MKAYADTGFLASLHCRDANSDRAIARMESHSVPMAWTWLHELEFRNAVRLQVFRKLIEPASVSLIMKDQASDLKSGIYFSAAPALSDVARDILHVSHAMVLGVREFLTFDIRQAALAKAAGLKVPDL